MIADRGQDGVGIGLGQRQTEDHFVGLAERRAVFVIVEPADNDGLVDVAPIERQQDQIAGIGGGHRADSLSGQGHAFECQPAVFQGHITAVVVAVAVRAMRLHLGHQTQLGDARMAHLFPDDGLDGVDDIVHAALLSL